MKYFDANYEHISSDLKLLPFFHSCDALVFRAIIENKKLLPQKCNVYKDENLLYLFYGRPAYKKVSGQSTKLKSFLPVSFILNSNSISTIKRVAPFDTGAFQSGMYKQYIHPNMTLENFYINPEITSIKKTVSYFYGENASYYSGVPKSEGYYDPLDFEIESFWNIIKSASLEDADDRKASIEVQLDSEILLNRNTMEAVVLPEHFLNSKYVRDILIDEYGVRLITYESYGIPSDHYYSEILSLTKKFLMQKQLFNESINTRKGG